MNPYAKPEHHVVTVRTGQEEDWTYLASVECVCTADEDEACRTYPDCGCEVFSVDPDNPGHDDAGHPFVSGRDCWVVQWFAAVGTGEATEFTGTGATNDTDVGVPLVAQHGHIDVDFDCDHLTWDWHGDPVPLNVPIGQEAIPLTG